MVPGMAPRGRPGGFLASNPVPPQVPEGREVGAKLLEEEDGLDCGSSAASEEEEAEEGEQPPPRALPLRR